MQQSIRLCRSTDGTTIAWADSGTGPAMVKTGTWLTHLQYDWDSPVWRHWFRFLAGHYRCIRYDERGCGMSDWNTPGMSLDQAVADLETVIEAARPRKPFVLLGVSQGGAVAIRYAVEHPENVSHLVLYGAYAQGMAVQDDPELQEQSRACIALTRLGWGKDNPVYRQLLTSRFVPDASEEQIRWYNELCRRTATPEMAARILEFRMRIDVAELLPRVTVPTLVLHSRGDEAVPACQGRLVATSIPAARFVDLDSRNHILLETEPAWRRFKEATLAFTGQPRQAVTVDHRVFAILSPREREILAWINQGCTNLEIGRGLHISEKTVRNHVTRIFEKLSISSRAQAIVLARDRGLGAGREARH